MARSPQIERILNLATELYKRGAVPEAMAIAREVFVSLLDRDELTELLPNWIRSLTRYKIEPPSPSMAVMKAIDSLGVVLDTSASIRAVTNLCTVQPYGAAVAERALRGLHVFSEQSPRRWRRLPVALRSRAIGWEIASPVLAAANRQRLALPEDFTSQIAARLPQRERQALSPDDMNVVNSYAYVLSQQGHEEPGIRLAVTSVVTSRTPVQMGQVIEIVRPNVQVRQAAELFDRRGYPTEAANVLMDSIHGLSVAAEEWQQLKAHAGRWLDERSEPGERQRGQRGKPPTPPSAPTPESSVRSAGSGVPPPQVPEKPPDPWPAKSFFFLLKGEQAFKDQVVRGQSADLYFLYDVPVLEALARFESKTLDALEEAAREGELIEIGVFIKPVGFTFRGIEKDYQIAKIEGDELTTKVCFRLQAHEQPVADPGVHAVLTFNGAEVFQAFISIAVVDVLDRAPSPITQLAISRSLFDRNDALRRDITAFITTDEENGFCCVTMRVGNALPTSPKPLDLNQLDSELMSARNTLANIAELPAFRTMLPGRWTAEPGSEPEFLGALCRMMSAGSRLYKFLHESAATEGLVEAIDKLDDGATISIFTDSAFVPWEILFPHYFFSDAERVTPNEEPDGFAPTLLWGNRFQVETVLMFANPSQRVQHVLPAERRQPGTLNIRIGVGSTVEPEPEPGTSGADASLNAIVRHHAYCDQNPSIAHWLDGSAAVRKAFADSDYDVSLLYLMCHGKSNGADEQLDFGAYQPVPEWLNPERSYPGWPVVFINSCSIASVSPHVFDSFLRRFREKNAFGLIASSFPLPTRFATLFGCEFLDGYQRGMKVGELLLDLRRRLLRNNNPLGFFYTLQCPLDVQRPRQPLS